MTISRAFGITFACALAFEVLRFAVAPVGLLANALSVAGYLSLVALGFLLRSQPQPYRTAFANTWPFVILWFAIGIFSIRLGLGDMPSGWTADDTRHAQWGYLLASILFLPAAFGASALGVWVAGVVARFHRGKSNAA